MLTDRQVTLLYLVRRDDCANRQVCLTQKKAGVRAGLWGGLRGAMRPDEDLEMTVRREAMAGLKVSIGWLKKVAEFECVFPENRCLVQRLHAYVCEEWAGVPEESDKLTLGWYDAAALPYDQMGPHDKLWLPQVLTGQMMRGRFTYGAGPVCCDSCEVVEMEGM